MDLNDGSPYVFPDYNLDHSSFCWNAMGAGSSASSFDVDFVNIPESDDIDPHVVLYHQCDAPLTESIVPLRNYQTQPPFLRIKADAAVPRRGAEVEFCRNAIPNCGRHRQPTSEQHARTASWMRTDQATGSNRGTSESSKRMITLHTRVLPERALIYSQ